jgi:hypothetical protein
MLKTQVVSIFGPGHDQAFGGPDPQYPSIEQYGVLTKHAVIIARYCYRSQRLLILRAPSASSVVYRRQNIYGHSDTTANKPVFEKAKTGGGLTAGGFYSDYDILSFWEYNGTGYTSLVTGARAPQRIDEPVTAANVHRHTAAYLADAPEALFQLVMATGITEFQHGAQDEFVDAQGRPRLQLANERFVAFDHRGLVHLVPDTGAMKRFYASLGLRWVYA